MKKIAIIAALLATSAFAADNVVVAKNLHKLLEDVQTSSNAAKFENVKYELDGYVVRVDSKIENGEKFYLAQIADAWDPRTMFGPNGRATYRVSSGRLLCVMDRSAAAGLQENKKVSFTAFTVDVQEIAVQEYGSVNKYKTLIAHCQF